MNRKEIGSKYERLTAKYLQKKGFKILDVNYRNMIGEIDIICRDSNSIIFVEVKARKNNKYGLPRESVTWHKKDKIRKTSLIYIKNNKLYDLQYRYDVVEIFIHDKKINHIEYAF